MLQFSPEPKFKPNFAELDPKSNPRFMQLGEPNLNLWFSPRFNTRWKLLSWFEPVRDLEHWMGQTELKIAGKYALSSGTFLLWTYAIVDSSSFKWELWLEHWTQSNHKHRSFLHVAASFLLSVWQYPTHLQCSHASMTKFVATSSTLYTTLSGKPMAFPHLHVKDTYEVAHANSPLQIYVLTDMPKDQRILSFMHVVHNASKSLRNTDLNWCNPFIYFTWT